MASVNPNPVNEAVKALERAMRAGHEHRRRVAQAAYAEHAAPPVPNRGQHVSDAVPGGAA